MSQDPAFLFYSNDFLSGVLFLSMEDRGKYITLLCQQHQSGHIPEDHILKICGSIDSPVMKKFKKDNKGFYYNIRLENEIKKRKKYSDSRRKNVMDGRWNKGKKRNKIEYTCNTHVKDMNSISNTHVIHTENENVIKNNTSNLDKNTQSSNLEDTSKDLSRKSRAKEPKHKYGESKKVLLTEKEYKKLEADLGKDKLAYWIDKLDYYIENSKRGKEYTNHSRTIRNWHRKENQGQKTVAQKRLEREMDDELTQEEINAGIINLNYDPRESNGAKSN